MERIIETQLIPEAKRSHLARVLILGGTSEASEIATLLVARDDLDVISSLAGRITNPRLPDGMVRIGGFGGVAGLVRYLVDEKIDAVIDATHPFASKISGNAEIACSTLSVPLIALERPPWERQAGDCWRTVVDMHAAAAMVNHKKSRVFLSIGRQELGAFSGCEQASFLVRAIDEPNAVLPPNSELVLKRGPFDLNDELQMLRDYCISVIVSKNSGGTATYSKIEAARELRIPVVMIARPPKHNIPTVSKLNDVLEMLAHYLNNSALKYVVTI